MADLTLFERSEQELEIEMLARVQQALAECEKASPPEKPVAWNRYRQMLEQLPKLVIHGSIGSRQ